jgi:D-glycero-D-manno-heptose 1,7-bisphosphate phosphatase
MPEFVILDRDGVINQDQGEYVRSPEQWCPIPGSLEAIAHLNRAGFRVVVATNQAGIRKRLYTVEDLAAIHARMHRQICEAGGLVEAVFFCACLPREGCECFKPRPGMLLDIAARLRIRLEGVPFVGDKRSDVEAARAVGARPILVRTGHGEATLAQDGESMEGVEVYADLAEAAMVLADRRSPA